ncbi:MAG: ERF family protein [Spirochaetales bacterium]|nr:ERF family protein [Spirochaetales bacterium]
MKELMEIQKGLIAPKNKNGGKYNYRSAEDILEAAKPLLVSNGCTLVISDTPILVGERVYIKSTATIKNLDGDTESADGLAHEGAVPSGQRGDFMSAPQWTGSCSSYARKLALGGLFAIDNNDDPDKIGRQLNQLVPMTDEQENTLLGFLAELQKTEDPRGVWLAGRMAEGLTEVDAAGVINKVKGAMGW